MIAPWTAVHHMLSHPFMAHAFLAGSAVALCAGAVGYFLVLRAQVFTADALSHVAFTGALGALVLGLDLRLGLFVVSIAVALGMGGLGQRGRPDDVVIGGVFAWILGLGVLCLSVYATHHSDGSASVSVLFGSILGLSEGRAWLSAAIGLGVLAALAAIARPLLFSSLDEDVAVARGVPARALGLGFLALTGATAAEASQVIGALLILGLLAAPAGAAHRLTDRPYLALVLSSVIALLSTWIGLSISYAAPRVPPSFAIIAVATTTYAAAALRGLLLDHVSHGRAQGSVQHLDHSA